MQIETQTKGRGGRREGSGRKKTTEKRVMFGASAEALAVLENLTCRKSEFINAAILAYAAKEHR